MTSAAASPTPTRPTVVTVAVWFQAALVVLLLIVVGVTIAEAIHYDGLIDRAALGGGAEPSEVASERDSNLGFSLVFGLPLVVLLLWLAVTLAWVRRGSNVARILTWVGLGAPVGLCLVSCLFGGLIGFFGLLAFGSGDESFDEPVDDEDFTAYQDGGFYDRLYDLDSGGWSLAFDAIHAVTLVSAVLFAIATAVLLMTGPADRYFRPGRQRLPSPFPYAGPWPVHPAGPQWYGHPGPPPPPTVWGPPPPPMVWGPPPPPMGGPPPPPHQHPWSAPPPDQKPPSQG